jgi:hypothetical protein
MRYSFRIARCSLETAYFDPACYGQVYSTPRKKAAKIIAKVSTTFRNRRKWIERRRSKICELLANGLTWAKIEARLRWWGSSLAATARYYKIDVSVTPQGAGLATAREIIDSDSVRDLYQRCGSYRLVAKCLRCSPESVRKICSGSKSSIQRLSRLDREQFIREHSAKEPSEEDIREMRKRKRRGDSIRGIARSGNWAVRDVKRFCGGIKWKSRRERRRVR